MIAKIVDFLLEECIHIESYDLKVEIFINVCKFTREWFKRYLTVVQGEKLFECLTKLIMNFNLISIRPFTELIDILLRLPNDVKVIVVQQLKLPEDAERRGVTFIELIHFIENSKKQGILVEFSYAVLHAIMLANRND